MAVIISCNNDIRPTLEQAPKVEASIIEVESSKDKVAINRKLIFMSGVTTLKGEDEATILSIVDTLLEVKKADQHLLDLKKVRACLYIQEFDQELINFGVGYDHPDRIEVYFYISFDKKTKELKAFNTEDQLGYSIAQWRTINRNKGSDW